MSKTGIYMISRIFYWSVKKKTTKKIVGLYQNAFYDLKILYKQFYFAQFE